MQNDKIYSEIITAFARTRAEANLLENELDLLLRSLYKSGAEDFDNTLKKKVRAKIAYAIAQGTAQINKEVFLENLKILIRSLNYIKLTIAFEPTLEVIDRLSVWLRDNIASNIAIDFEYDKKIIAGAIVEYHGKIHDLSILPAIDNYFKNANF